MNGLSVRYVQGWFLCAFKNAIVVTVVPGVVQYN